MIAATPIVASSPPSNGESVPASPPPTVWTGRRIWPLGVPATIFLFLVVLFPTLAYVLMADGWPLPDDAMSRIALASYVIFGRDPHLAAIGFVWNPLPSLAEIPFLALLRPFGLQLLAGPIQSAIAMAGTAALFWLYFGLHGMRRSLRVLFLGLFVLNPMVLLYAMNGMSEAQLVFFLVGTAYMFSLYVRRGGDGPLIGMALMGAGGFAARYESVAFIGAAILGVIFAFFTSDTPDAPRLEATLLVYLAPVAYVVFMWLYANALIMGDPLFFWRGPYSNSAQAAQAGFRDPSNPLSAVIGSVPGTLLYAFTRLEFNCFAFAGVLLLAALLLLRHRDWHLFILASMGISVPVFETLLIYSGSSFGWFRFFLYSTPATFLLIPPILGHFRRPGARRVLVSTLFVLLVASDLLCLWGTARTDVAPEADIDTETFPFISRGPSYVYPAVDEQRPIAAYIDENLPDSTVLVDTFLGADVPLLAHNPAQFFITNDRDFPAKLSQLKTSADYVLVPSATGLGGVDLVNGTYPTLYDGGEPWATFIQEFPGSSHWRLFRIDKNVP